MEHEFVLTWDRYMDFGTVASIVGAILIFLYHIFGMLF